MRSIIDTQQGHPAHHATSQPTPSSPRFVAQILTSDTRGREREITNVVRKVHTHTHTHSHATAVNYITAHAIHEWQTGMQAGTQADLAIGHRDLHPSIHPSSQVEQPQPRHDHRPRSQATVVVLRPSVPDHRPRVTTTRQHQPFFSLYISLSPRA